MHKRCDWKRRLLDVLGIRINVPQLTNKYLPCQQQQSSLSSSLTSKHHHSSHRRLEITIATANATIAATLSCPSVGGLIAHHKWVGEFFLADPHGAHMCEYSFFVDKIKDEVSVFVNVC